LSRKGKAWELWVDDGREIQKPLVECSLAIKLKAIKAFPDLLEAVTVAQAQLESELGSAVERFDKFASGLPGFHPDKERKQNE